MLDFPSLVIAAISIWLLVILLYLLFAVAIRISK